jgi:DNA (cytosine-5)-methyltransferase 1
MKVGSLCTGYGGLEMAVESVFGSTDLRFVSDIDKDVNALLTHYYSNVPNLGDLTKVDWNDVERVDLLCAGYPCQPFSLAGNRKGEDDERAIFEYIADGISILRPRWLLLENVPGHTSLGGTSVIGTLTRLGYDARWGIIRASDTGAPHKRARLFIWADNGDSKVSNGRLQELQTLDKTTRQTTKFRESDSSVVTDTEFKGLQRRSSRRSARFVEDVPGQDRQVATGSSEIVANTESLGFESIRSECGLGEESEQRSCEIGFFGPYEHAIRRWEHVIGREAPYPVDDRGVEPKFVEWMMGLPQGYVTDLGFGRSSELRMLGNGVVPQQGALAIELLTTLL